MKFSITLFIFLLPLTCLAQADTYFVIKGNVKNLGSDFFEIGTSGFMESGRHSIKVDSKGNFNKRIKIEGLQDVYLPLNNDLFTIYASPGDTVLLKWDTKKFENTFIISSPKQAYDRELKMLFDLNMATNRAFRKAHQNTHNKNLTDSAKYEEINQSYENSLKLLSKYQSVSEKIVYDIYFKHVDLLYNAKLLDKFTLKSEVQIDAQNVSLSHLSPQFISTAVFEQSPVYRDFLFNRVRFFQTPFGSINFDLGTGIFNPTKADFAMGEALIPVRSVREWYLAKAIRGGFEHYDFANTREIYHRFLSSYPESKHAEPLRSFYTAFSRLAPGQIAPAFTLKDVNNKSVSLSDFAGKVVLIDFWGVYCGSCIADITRNGEKVHDKYKDKDVVFINICVDETGNKWKKKVMDLGLTGVNLVAEGWTKHPVVNDYHIHGIPNYVLIGRDGKIIDRNVPGLFHLVSDQENKLDKALSAAINVTGPQK
ncbi:TlpA family protein disulfide reductase [Pedobacter deserti]|uniref:TlpA family protein disulfide reductase n=1 Tax=Pedobacter deserti TaxID=2817382 RepID=UPI00210DA548|nr:TlpA disulfide reductase family protein [Pedobacter sp. SYSU D00382]